MKKNKKGIIITAAVLTVVFTLSSGLAYSFDPGPSVGKAQTEN